MSVPSSWSGLRLPCSDVCAFIMEWAAPSLLGCLRLHRGVGCAFLARMSAPSVPCPDGSRWLTLHVRLYGRWCLRGGCPPGRCAWEVWFIALVLVNCFVLRRLNYACQYTDFSLTDKGWQSFCGFSAHFRPIGLPVALDNARFGNSSLQFNGYGG